MNDWLIIKREDAIRLSAQDSKAIETNGVYGPVNYHFKPFPTCETCDKWHTIDCPHKQVNLRLGRGLIDKPEMQYLWTDIDDHCKYHSDFNLTSEATNDTQTIL